MEYLQQLLFEQGLSVIFPALAGLIRWPKLSPSDRPIVLICVFYIVNEVIRRLLITNGYVGYASYNVGALIAALLYIWQFTAWGLFLPSKITPGIIAGFFTTVWLMDHFVINTIHDTTLIFRLCLIMSLIILALMHLNKLITTERQTLYNNGRFLITVAILVYNIYRIVMDSFNQTGFSNDFKQNLSDTHRFILLGLYLFFFIGILCLPKKKAFFMPS